MNKFVQNFPIELFQDLLLTWFERNMRELPWREDRDPYKIWVSEIMLQQTQVNTVIPYFNRFMAAFPTLQDLADAEEDKVLKHWEGLGYYSRARNLHAAVKEVQERYEGQVPQTRKEISSLKGVGPYTAGAILSIAFGQREHAVDGNVMRVISRLFEIDQDIQKPKTRKIFEELVKQLIPENASYFNQGLMELGALVCTPQSPSCQHCPVQSCCSSFAKQTQLNYPVKTKKKQSPLHKMVAGVLMQDNQVLIRQRPSEGLLARLYEFPNLEWEEDPQKAICQHLFNAYQLKAYPLKTLESVSHVFTHLKWEITVYLLAIENDRYAEEGEHQTEKGEHQREKSLWVRLSDLEQYAFPVSHQKILKQIT
jgi:A/G-specific adenine glycosylase